VAESSFTSRDGWPIWLWLFLIFLAGSLSLAVEAALGNRLAWMTFLIQLILLLWASLKAPLEIFIDQECLRVGSATIERRFIGEVTHLSSAEMALLRGRDADPRCWMAIRFWVTTGVKIEIIDPADPTPYWLVSAKRAAALATALKKS
jgi:Protein of unknown function (DUF3093)